VVSTANGTQKRLRDEVADLDHRIGKQIEALEQGVEPQLVSKRIEKLRRAKEAAEIELRALSPASADSGVSEDPSALLARLSDLGDALRNAPTKLKRQVFEAFCLPITTTRRAGASRSPPTSQRPSRTPSRTSDTSRRRSRASLTGT
jgi:hypothetical protein